MDELVIKRDVEHENREVMGEKSGGSDRREREQKLTEEGIKRLNVKRSIIDFTELPNIFLGSDAHVDEEILNPIPVITMQLKIVSFILFPLFALSRLFLLDGATALQFLS